MDEGKLVQIHTLAQDAGLSVKEIDEYLTPLYKKDHLEKIYHLSCEAGLPLKSILDYLKEKEGDSMLLTDKEILPGMFVYEGNTFAKGLISHRKVKAIICYVQNGMAYAICPAEEKLPWSSTKLPVKTTQGMNDGREATREILKAAQETNGQAEAARWCHDYAENGIKQGEAFLPSTYELTELYSNIEAVNASLKMLGSPLLDHGIWTSNEAYESCAWSWLMQYNTENGVYKSESYPVWPMLTIKL